MINIYANVSVKIENPIILDIGCSIGLESIKLAAAFPDFKKMVSIDPFSECIEKVNSEIASRNESSRWFTECCAIDSKDGETWVQYGPLSEMGNFPSCGLPMQSVGNIVDTNNIQSNNRLIKTKTVESIEPNPDIMKIDIEGYEWFIWDYILSIKSVKIIFLELHGNNSINLNEKIDKAKDLGFSIKCYNHTALHSPASYMDIGTYRCQFGEYCQITLERLN